MSKESTVSSKGKAYVVVDEEKNSAAATTKAIGYKKALAIFDFLLRLAAIGAIIAAAVTLYTAEETLPFFTQFLQFQANYNDIPIFTFFVTAMATVGGYLVLSLPLSIVTIIRPFAVLPRLLLIIFDTVAVTLNTAAAAATASIVELAHNGNGNTNWLPICQQFGDFCQAASTAIVSASIAVLFFIFLILISAFALKTR